MKLISSAKLKIGSVIIAGTLVSGLGGAVLFNGVAHGEWDLPGLQQQVQHITEVTDNHEGRITNLENANTPAGQPTPTPVVVTKVVTQAAPSTTPAPAPVQPAIVTPKATSWYESPKCYDIKDNANVVYDYVVFDDGSTKVMDPPMGVPKVALPAGYKCP